MKLYDYFQNVYILKCNYNSLTLTSLFSFLEIIFLYSRNNQSSAKLTDNLSTACNNILYSEGCENCNKPDISEAKLFLKLYIFNTSLMSLHLFAKLNIK